MASELVYRAYQTDEDIRNNKITITIMSKEDADKEGQRQVEVRSQIHDSLNIDRHSTHEPRRNC